jgi:hypothetical protein
MSDQVKLSASRIKTAQSCTWLYWAKYKLKLPDSSNDGASRGSVCHNIFECLGNPRHKKHYKRIIKDGDIWGCDAVSRMVTTQAKALKVADEDNLSMINDFIMNGLRYDFFGDELGKPTKAVSEERFDIKVDEDGKRYNILGFIDKLFLYSKKRRAIIRDFKTSKAKFKGKEATDNLQALMYSLAVKHLYPRYLQRELEFLFLKFDLEKDLLGQDGEGMLRMEKISEDELEGFEYYLTEVQEYLENFGEEEALSNLAAKQNYPTDGSFGGPLSCGFAKYPDQLKKDGTPMWHCTYKFPFDYLILKDSNGVKIKTAQLKDEGILEGLKKDGDTITTEHYKGCPHWNKPIERDEFDL